MEPRAAAVQVLASSPAGMIPLREVTVTVRPGGVTVRAEPDSAGPPVGTLREGARQRVLGLLWRADGSWLAVPWENGRGWIAGESTDFARSAAYNQVAGAWIEAEPVVRFRRTLLRDLLRVRGADAERLAQVDELRGEALRSAEETLTRQTVPPPVARFWTLRERLGLPDAFEHLPVHTSPPARIEEMVFHGFGPTTYAQENWQWLYDETRGLHSGVDYFVPEGSPLIAVADGVITGFRFSSGGSGPSLALRPYLPESVRKPDGARVLSNLVVVYRHLTGNPTGELVRVGDEVRAGEIIGTSGWPLYTRDDGSVGVQHNNAHLHLETHLIAVGGEPLDDRTPFNPLLFWSPRLIAWQARLASHSSTPPYPQIGQPFGRLGFFSLGAFSYDPPMPRVWEYAPTREALWPEGVYDLDHLVKWLEGAAPYAGE